MNAAAAAEARRWIGTPYRHQASLRDVGCDCLGLVRGVWRELFGAEPEALPPYRPDWAEVGGEETLLAAARRWMVEIKLAEAAVGDVLLFRMTPDACVKHCGIVSESGLDSQGERSTRFVHAYWGRSVVESGLGSWWRRRLAAAFRFPDSRG